MFGHQVFIQTSYHDKLSFDCIELILFPNGLLSGLNLVELNKKTQLQIISLILRSTGALLI